jgi:glycerol kinase
VPVERPANVDTTALGAAGLAGIAGGVWKDASAFATASQFTRFAPGAGTAAAADGAKQWRRAVRATLAWARDTAE